MSPVTVEKASGSAVASNSFLTTFASAVQDTLKSQSQYEDKDNYLMRVALELDEAGTLLRTNSYSFFSLLRDFGGVIELCLLFFSFFMLPISEYSFNMWAGRKLYFGSS